MPPDYRSRRVLHAAEEGDPVLFNDRKRPLKVTDVGGKPGDHYLVVRGPRGGTYTIREKSGSLSVETKHKSERCRDLRFAEVGEAAKTEYGDVENWAIEGAYEMMADDGYDYSEWSVATLDAAEDTLDQLDDSQIRAILMAAPDNAFDQTLYENIDRESDRERLALAILTDHITQQGMDYADSDLSSSLSTKNDVDALVDKGLVMARNYVEAAAADDMDEAAEAAARALCDDLTTADHQTVLDFLPRPEKSILDRLAFDAGELVPWGDRTTAYERAVAYVTAGILTEHDEREKAKLIGDKQSLSLEDFFERYLDMDLSEMDLPTQMNTPKLPMLSDGGMPHTTLDEATKLYLRDVPVTAGDWQLVDGGLVTDGETRRMAWIHPDGEMVLMTSIAHDDGNGNDWFVFALDLDNDTTDELYDGTSFDDAIDTVTDYIMPADGEAEIEFVNDGNNVRVTENINEEALGERMMGQMGVVGDLAAQAGTFVFGLGANAALATGRAAGEVGAWTIRKYRRQVGELLLATVGTAILHNASKVVGGLTFTPIVEHDRLGFDTAFKQGAELVTRTGEVAAENWEAVEFDMDRGQYRLANTKNGNEMWAAPGEKEDLFHLRKTLDPYEAHIADGSILAWGVPYDEIADVFDRWGENVSSMTFGDGRDEYRQTWKPTQTGDPRSTKKRNRRSSSPTGTGKFNRDWRNTDTSSSPPDRQPKGSYTPDNFDKEYADAIGVSMSEIGRSWGDKLASAKNILSIDTEKLTDDLLDGMDPTEAGRGSVSDGGHPQTADDIENAVGDADRMEMLSHPNRSEEVDLVVDADDIGPEPDSYDERRDRHREEAEQYYQAQSPEAQVELDDTRAEVENIRRFSGSEKTDRFDPATEVAKIREMRENRQKDKAKTDYSRSRPQPDPDEEFEFAEEEGFFSDWDETDPADEGRWF